MKNVLEKKLDIRFLLPNIDNVGTFLSSHVFRLTRAGPQVIKSFRAHVSPRGKGPID
jgi:hypothetical protein